MKVIKWILSLILSVLLVFSLFSAAFVFSVYKNDYMSILSEIGLDFGEFDDFDYYDDYDDSGFQNHDLELILEMIENGNFDDKELKKEIDELFSDPQQQKMFVDMLEQNKGLVKFYLQVSDLDAEQLISLLKDYPEMQKEIKKILEEK